jgi:gliding motility-associated-like protein
LYQWNGSPQGDINSLIFTADSSTFFDLQITDFCGTQADTSVSFVVERPVAVAAYEYIEEELVIQLFNASEPEILNYLWDFGDNTTSIEFEPIHLYNDYDDHVIILTVSTDRGCVDEYELIYKAPSSVFIPNAFTPDGNDPNNYISVRGYNIKTVKMQIFDRWGKQVYEINSPDERWYGESQKNNKGLTTSVYNYVIEWTDYRDDSFRKTGSILLIR